MKSQISLRNSPLAGPGVRLLTLIALLTCASVQPAFSQKPEPGKWIPLPYYRSGSWWMPVDAAKPTKLNARLVALSGRDSYLITDSSDNQALIRNPSTPPLSADQTNQSIVHGQSPAEPVLPPPSSLTPNGWTLSSNSQPLVSPHSMDYNSSLGLLCVVQTIGENQLGSELRVWDLRSRSCLWRHRLPGSPYSPVGVRILNNGLVYVSGGYGKYTSCYLGVYDLNTRQTVLEKHLPGTRHLGRLRMFPLPDGQRVLTVPSLLPESPDAPVDDLSKGLRLFDMKFKMERTFLPDYEVWAVVPMADGTSALVGTKQGEILRVDLNSGSHTVVGTSSGTTITALAVTEDATAWAAGTIEGDILRGRLRESLTGIQSGGLDATLSSFGGEVTGLAFVHGSTSKLAVRVAGKGHDGFYAGYSIENSAHANGLIWDDVTGERRPLPPGAGICPVEGSILALGLSDGSGVVLYDAATGAQSEPLGSFSPGVLERGTFTGEGLDKPSALRTNFDGSQLLIRGKLFDFKSLRFEPLSAGRSLTKPIIEAAFMRMQSPQPVRNDSGGEVVAQALEQGGREIESEEVLDVLLLGPSRTPARVLLYPDPNTVSAFSGLSPSGKVAAIFSQWKGTGDLRLVDLERSRVMSQPNQGSLTENLQNMSFIGWVKPLDDGGHRVLAIHSNLGMVDMLDYAGGQTISRFEFGGEAAAACCSVEGRRLFIATDDAAIYCLTWDDAGRLTPVGRLDLGRHDTWSLTLPNGVFMSSGAERLMVLAGNRHALPLDTGAAAFHRPHDVARAFGASPAQITLLERAYIRRCQRDGLAVALDQQIDLNSLPRTKIRDRQTRPLSVREASFNFTVEAMSSNAQLNKLLIEVNGVPLDTWKKKLPEGLMTWTGEIQLTLAPGDNRIQISAIDSQGRQSLRETLVVWYVAPPLPPALFLVAVGVSDYNDDRLDLGAASKDAQDLADFLGERKDHGCREVRSLIVTDKQATREGILQARNFLRTSQEGDRVIVFVAGHGFVDQDGLRYWFGTHDIDVDAVEKRGISYLELESLFDGVPARNRLLLMDTCFAGEVDVDSSISQTLAANVKSRAPALASAIRKPADGSFDLMRELFGDLRRHTGATVITASSGMEHVYAEEREEGDNGVFTYCLLDGLRTGKADIDGDGFIRLSELQAYLITQVPSMTGGRQRPTGRFLNQNADFVIGRAKPRPSFDAKKLVGEYLELTSQNGNGQNTKRLFAPVVDYFGKSQTSDQIVQAEESYHQKFPQRTFYPLYHTLRAQEITERQKRIEYHMKYTLTSHSGDQKAGSQDIEMLVLLHEGTWKITAIKVLKSADTSPPARTSTTAPASPPPVTQQGTLQGAVARFLTLSSANGQEQQFAAMFADTVDYFGTRKTRAQILKEELAYHRDWPYRRLSLVGDVQQINVGAGEMLARYTMSMWKSKTQQEGDSLQLNMEMRLRQINGTWFISGMKVRKP